jgi:predicted nucleic acid-binding protein
VRFVDTSVLLYTVSTMRAEMDKRRTARDVLDGGDVALSVQVLQEFYVQATRPTRADPLQHEQAVGLIEAWCRFPVQETTLGLVRAALDTSARYRLSYWDATIVEAARLAGCRVLLSEDLSDGQDFNGVHVENPFA